MAFAIGTDIAHMAGKSLISTLRHGKFGNVDYKLGLIMLFGTVIGFEVGAQMIMWLERVGNIDKVVRWIYIFLRLHRLDGFLRLAQAFAKKKKQAKADGREISDSETGVNWAKALHKIHIPPMVNLRTSGIYCSAWLPITVSFPYRLAGRYPGYWRRSYSHARPYLSRWLSYPRCRWY